MMDSMLFVALPYLAIIICVVGSIMRIRMMPMTYSALSSQFLESKTLVWGSVPWHIGIITVILAHLVALFFPGFWQMLMGYKNVLYVTEGLGLALAISCLFGLVVLTYRRVTSERVQAVTTGADLLVLVLLIVQVVLHRAWY